MKAKFAVLLAAKNGERWIYDQIHSILNQKDIELHLYINIDDSEDNTEKIIRDIKSTRDNITFFSENKTFGSAAKSFYYLLEKIPLRQYDYLCFSDQDDIWHEAKLITAYNKIKDGNYLGYSSSVTAFWEDGKKIIINKSQPQKKWDYLFESAGPGCTYVMSNALVSQFLEFLNTYRTEILDIDIHDWTIYAFSRARGLNWLIDENNSLVAYRQHSNNTLGANLGVRAATKRIEQIRKGIYSRKVLRITAITQPELVPEMINTKKNRLKKFFIMKNFYNLRRRKKDSFLIMLFSIMNIL